MASRLRYREQLAVAEERCVRDSAENLSATLLYRVIATQSLPDHRRNVSRLDSKLPRAGKNWLRGIWACACVTVSGCPWKRLRIDAGAYLRKTSRALVIFY